MSPWLIAFLSPWLVFDVWWLVRARGVARPVRRESRASRLSYGALAVAAGLCIAFGNRLSPSGWHVSRALAVLALGVEVAGVAFAIWAREHLGRMWSGTVTLKEDHRLIRSGPYRVVRHPIYTGVLVGLTAVVAVRGFYVGLLAPPLLVLAFWRKISVEERFLAAQFGDEHARYRREVAALIPFVL